MVDQGNRNRWLFGEHHCCSRTGAAPARPKRFILLGAPGVGKGTQAEFLCDHFETCHLSTGDVFRNCGSLKEEELGQALREALQSMRRGELVRDETVVGIVAERTHCLACGYGFLLDGFPRTVEQAQELDRLLESIELELDAVLDYELPMNQVLERLGGRRTCRGCKATFHLQSKPPLKEGVCDHCGGELYQREDDSETSIRVRLAAYEKSTKPVRDYYKDKVVMISAEGSPKEVFERTLLALGETVGTSV